MKRLSHLLWLLILITACGENQTPLAPAASPSPGLPTLLPATPSPIPPTPTLGPPQAVPVSPVAGLPQGSLGYPWWNDTIFYEIFVRSFYDSNGDGIGDLNGIIQKLDYLNDGDPNTNHDLGVTGIWLMPVFPSPSYHGYDTTDYYAVHPDYGTQEDFVRLIDEAHSRGIRVIIDLMLNHTSMEHPWFVASRDPSSAYRDWYVWSEDPGMRGPQGKVVWHPSPAGGYYYGFFWEGMPDLNYHNPAVTAELEKVARFWLEEMMVDGFRLDGARYLVEEDQSLEDTASNHAWLKDFREFFKEVNPSAVTVGEVWSNSFTVATYLRGDQLDLAFNFDLASAFIASANSGTAKGASDRLELDTGSIDAGLYATFLTNHDINRVMTQLGEDEEKAKNAATLLLTAPGAPFIYYGEEIAMTGSKPDELLRTPFQWSGEEHAGFSSSEPWQPVNQEYPVKNVADQLNDPNSLLGHYQTLIGLRNQHIALRVGQGFTASCENRSIYSLLRASQEEAVLVVINLSSEPASDCSLSLDSGPLSGAYRVAPLLGEDLYPDLIANEKGGFEAYQPMPVIPANARLILQLQAIQ